MNKGIGIGLVALSLTLASGMVAAEKTHGNRYMGVSVSFMDLERDGSSRDAGINHIEGRVGGFLNDYIALEGRAGVGITGETIEGIDVDLNYLVGGYVRAGMPLKHQLFPYILLGFTRAEIEAKGIGSSAETDTSIGVGLDANLDGLSLSLEYASLVDKNGASLSGMSVGIKTTF
jgi:hypothetical protein